MKKFLILVLSLLPTPLMRAQNIEHQIIASQYNVWQVAGYSPDTYTFTPGSCWLSAGNKNFWAFTQGTPVTIFDGNPTLNETVTPSLTIENNQTCTISVAPVNHHNVPFHLGSATGGLQEALNANAQNPATNTIVLDNLWHQAVGSTAAAVIAAAQGNYQLGLVDVTTYPYNWYQWNGTQYVLISIVGGVTAVTATLPVQSTGGTTPNISCPTCNTGPAYGFYTYITTAMTSSQTTMTLPSSVAGYPTSGTVVVDTEWMTYSGLNTGTNQLTGLVRGVNQTTPAAHSALSPIYSAVLPFGSNAQPPIGGIFGGGTGTAFLMAGCGYPGYTQGFGDDGAVPVLVANCTTPTWIDSAGRIHQNALGTIANFMSPIYIGTVSVDSPYALPVPILNTTNVAQTTVPTQFAQPIGATLGYYGPVSSIAVPNIPAPTVGGSASGPCSVTYVVSGVDADGNAIPGTPATASNINDTTGFAIIQVPSLAGIKEYYAYRTAVSGCAAGVTLGQWTSPQTTQYPYFTDNFTSGDSSTPPSTNNSVAKTCTSGELFCTLAGSGSTPPVACSSATAGWEYHNVAAATSPYVLHCVAGASSWSTAY
jgi:hypothetical protein